MTGCPSYVSITVINHVDAEELFRYDALVLCPPSFNITLRVPNSAHSLLSSPSSADYYGGGDETTTFEVRLSDPSQTYSVYLTHIGIRSNGDDDDSVEDINDGDDDELVNRKSEAVVIRSTSSIFHDSTSQSSNESSIFAGLAGVVLVSLVALTITLIHVDPATTDGVRRLRSPVFGGSCFQPPVRVPALPPYGYSYCDSRDTCRRPAADDNEDDVTVPLPQLPPPPRAPTSSSAAVRCDDNKQQKGCQSRSFGCCASSSPSNIRVLVLIYAALWIAYSFAATFTAVSLAVSVIVRPDVERIRSAADGFRIRSEHQRVLVNQTIMSAVDGHRHSELRRHARQMAERHRACETHVDRLYASWAEEIDILKNSFAGGPCADCRRLSAVNRQFERRYTDRSNYYVGKMAEYERTLRGRIDDALRKSIGKYNAYLKAVADSPWTSFVTTAVFNGTLLPVAGSNSRRSEAEDTSVKSDSPFGIAFEVDEVTIVHRWSNQFWQRLECRRS